jgi:P-type Ca2+ transporter type 2A
MMVAYPADLPCLLNVAMCSALCNDSSLYYAPEKAAPAPGGLGDLIAAGGGGARAGAYQRIGESTEVALRVLAEKVRLAVAA